MFGGLGGLIAGVGFAFCIILSFPVAFGSLSVDLLLIPLLMCIVGVVTVVFEMIYNELKFYNKE